MLQRNSISLKKILKPQEKKFEALKKFERPRKISNVLGKNYEKVKNFEKSQIINLN